MADGSHLGFIYNPVTFEPFEITRPNFVSRLNSTSEFGQILNSPKGCGQALRKYLWLGVFGIKWVSGCQIMVSTINIIISNDIAIIVNCIKNVHVLHTKNLQIKTKKTYRFKKKNILARTHKRRQIKLLNF